MLNNRLKQVFKRENTLKLMKNNTFGAKDKSNLGRKIFICQKITLYETNFRNLDD